MRIGIVNDIALIAEALRRLIVASGIHQVAWVAHSGTQAVQLCRDDTPDLVLMDLIMPDIDGVETTRRIMQDAPCAILIVTASPDENTGLVFRALGAGALDVVATPVVGAKQSDDTLLRKIRMIGKLIGPQVQPMGNGLPRTQRKEADRNAAEKLVAIGASTGGPAALTRVLRDWKPGPGTSVVIIQHIDLSFADSFANWLSDQIEQPVQAAREGMTPAAGQLLLAKTNDHLALASDQSLCYTREPAAYPYRPSVDVFFRSVAAHWQGQAAGVLLTGMGRDGAHGLLAMRNAGKTTIAQDRASSAVYGMPQAAAQLGAAQEIASLESIAAMLRKRF